MPASLLSTADNLEQLTRGIEDEYGIKIEETGKADKNNLLISTEDGLLDVEKIDDSETRLIFVTGIYDHVKNKGFKSIRKIHKTRYGKYYMKKPEALYILSDHLDDSKCAYQYKDNETGIIRLIAEFHKASAGYSPPSGGKGKSCWGRWIDEQRKELKDLKGFRDQIKALAAKEPFELMFVTSCDEYIGRMEKSISKLKKQGYLDNVEASMKVRQVCLGALKQSNFYNTGAGIYIKSLNKCRYDIREWDIALLLRKIIENYPEFPCSKLCRLVDVYNNEYPLADNSIDMIKAFLLHPSEYNRISFKWSQGKGKWTEGEYMEKLREAMLLEDRKMEFIKVLSSV